MLIPKEKPEVVQWDSIVSYTLFLLSSQISCVIGIYVMYNDLCDKPFIILFFVLYASVSVYVLAYCLDNSPLLGVSSMFVIYIYLYMFNVQNRYHNYIMLMFGVLLLGASVIKEKYSHEIHNKKPAILNVILYLCIGFMPYALPFHIYNQNRYYDVTLNGFQML